MIDYSDEQIIRDIAEWCGFKVLTERQVGLLLGLDDINDDTISDYCLDPKSNEEIPDPIPNFLDEIQGLGLLFKYAVPKLREVDATLDIFFCYGLGGSVEVTIDIHGEKTTAEDKSPARALALAIHKLIKEADNAGT